MTTLEALNRVLAIFSTFTAAVEAAHKSAKEGNISSDEFVTFIGRALELTNETVTRLNDELTAKGVIA